MRLPVFFGVVVVSVAALAAEPAGSKVETRRTPLRDRKVSPAGAGTGVERSVPAGGYTKLGPTTLYQPRREPTALALGSVSTDETVPCGDSFPAEATCTRISVACPGLPEVQATVAVSEPAGVAIATVILHNGSGGTTVFDNGFPTALLARGVRVVQILWTTDWPVPAGGKVSACRPASVFQWVFDHVHDADRFRGFCALGHSGGSAALAYSLSFYGLGDIFDFVLLNSGPPMGRVDYGCEPGLYPAGTRFVCPEIPAAPVAYESSRWDEINRIEATATCGDPLDDSSDEDRARWESDSVVSSGGVYDYPKTPLAFYYCSTDPNSAVGLGSFYVEQVSSSKVVNCVGGECIGEGTYRDPAAFAQMVDDLVTSCVPNHITGGS